MSAADTVNLAKGYIMHKLYHYGYVCPKTGHGKHIPVDALPKGCPAELKPHVREAIEQLKRDGLVSTWPTSYGDQCCGVRNTDGYGLANTYQKHAGLPVVDYERPIRPISKVPPLTRDQLNALKLRHRKRT